MNPERALELNDRGAHFFRTDLQVHTPRDTQWDGERPSSETDRTEWAASFVRAARERGLHAVAISDHHDFAFFPYVRAAAKAETASDGSAIPEDQQLVVFPALELTFSVPCQAILVLDADFPADRLDDVLKALHFDPIDPSLAIIPQTQPLPDSGDIGDLLAKLDKNQWLRGRYILLPNLTANGHKTLLRTSFQDKFKDMSCVGGYLDGSIEQLDLPKNKGERRILDGGDPNWGSKRMALFQTSDSRTSDFGKLGLHATWTKWSSPTAEALRQACLAQDSRIAHNQPALPNAWISRVVVSQSKFMGRLDVALNPQFTALIGGRGTGKSTILDYLRWALCDQPAATVDDDELANPKIRQRNLVGATLKPLEAHVEVHCIINGISHVVRRRSEDGSVALKVGVAEFEEVTESAIRSLLPIQAYSQKQLSSVSIRVDELLRFVTTPIKRDLEEIERRQKEIEGRLRENYGSLQRHRNLSKAARKSELRSLSLTEQAQSVRNSLSGLSDTDRAVLESKPALDLIRSTNRGWNERVADARQSLADAVSALEDASTAIVIPDPVPDIARSEVDAVAAATQALLNAASAQLEPILENLDMGVEADPGLKAERAALLTKLNEFDQQYTAVTARSSAHEAKLEELSDLERQHNDASELLASEQEAIRVLGDPRELHFELRRQLTDARDERTAMLASQCEALESASDGMIRATLSQTRGFSEAQAKFKAMIAGSNVRSARVEQFIEELSSETDPSTSWETVLAELEQLLLLEPDSPVTSELTPTLSRLSLSLDDQRRIAPKLTPDSWLDLSLTELSHHPMFEFRSKEEEYIPFAAASAGQQASALLTTLLSQTGTPLIVDQPEDDLDSETVQQIVSKIWTSKSGRQLIFSSHNANLVVNGDADLVLVCAYVNTGDQSAGHIHAEGAIDVQEIRDQITSVMEGGEKAFRLRQEKYGF